MTTIIDRDNSKKLYVQLYEILKVKIESGQWPVNSQIPTEDELCRQYEVSKATVRIAVAELAKSGYLVRQQGRGTFVCKRIIPEGLSMITSFKEMMLEAGVLFKTKVLAKTIMMPTDDLDLMLDTAEDSHIIYIKRIRTVENEPVLLQESYLPYSICPGIMTDDVETSSLLELIEEKHQIKISKVQDYIEVMPVPEEAGALLGLAPLTPVLLLEQKFFAGNQQIMYTRSLKRPERFRFFIELSRK
jgi:DNA-binding GntR family transcriptional regulator